MGRVMALDSEHVVCRALGITSQYWRGCLSNDKHKYLLESNSVPDCTYFCMHVFNFHIPTICLRFATYSRSVLPEMLYFFSIHHCAYLFSLFTIHRMRVHGSYLTIRTTAHCRFYPSHAPGSLLPIVVFQSCMSFT